MVMFCLIDEIMKKKTPFEKRPDPTKDTFLGVVKVETSIRFCYWNSKWRFGYLVSALCNIFFVLSFHCFSEENKK